MLHRFFSLAGTAVKASGTDAQPDAAGSVLWDWGISPTSRKSLSCHESPACRRVIPEEWFQIDFIRDQDYNISELSYNYYKPLVDKIIAEKASEKEVEHLLDYMLDVCHDDRMLNLFKNVCRRYYSLYPGMITSEILAYKEWYEN